MTHLKPQPHAGHDWGGAVANDFAAMYPARVEKLVMISVPPSPLFMDNMDLHQLSCSFYLWQILVPGVMEHLLPLSDWAVIELMFTQEAWGGLVQRDITDEDVEHYKDAAAAPGAIKAALSYHRCACFQRDLMLCQTLMLCQALMLCQTSWPASWVSGGCCSMRQGVWDQCDCMESPRWECVFCLCYKDGGGEAGSKRRVWFLPASVHRHGHRMSLGGCPHQ